MPRFSVLMPTHYRPDVIGLAIRSVLGQTAADFELLVVGDGAAPGTADVVAAFADPRIRWFDLPKAPGYGYANRNLGMRAATGELIAFAADDDLMLPDHLEKLGAEFADGRVQWAYSQALWVSADGIAAPDLTNLDAEDERAFFLQRSNTIAAGSLMFRAAALPPDPWPEEIGRWGDWHIMRRLLEAYGLPAMRRVAEPTFLHFVAGRKTARHSEFGALAGWLAVADSSPWWPAALRLGPADGVSLQAACWQRLVSDPGTAAQWRRAATDAVNRLALELVDGPGRGLEAIAGGGSATTLAAEISALKASASWRLTAPLRALGRLRRRLLP